MSGTVETLCSDINMFETFFIEAENRQLLPRYFTILQMPISYAASRTVHPGCLIPIFAAPERPQTPTINHMPYITIIYEYRTFSRRI
jgi:hypothetical protein